MNASKLSRLALAIALALPAVASAESTFSSTTGAGALSTTAHLNFTVTIPKILYLRVGSGGTGLAANTTIDGVTFTVPAANVGDSSVIASSSPNVAVRVVGNNGQIALTSTTTGDLSNGAGDSIPFSQIAGVSSDSAVGGLGHPPLTAGGGTSSLNISPNIGAKVTDRSALWTFTYLNAAVVPPGTYGATIGNNGQVTYTASMP